VKKSSKLSSRLYSVSLSSFQRPRFDLSAFVEAETGDPAYAGNILVLFSNRLFQDVYLNMAGLFGEFARMNQVLVVRVERAQKRRGETAGGPQPGSSRDVSHAGDFHAARVDPRELDRFAHERMLQFVRSLDVFHF